VRRRLELTDLAAVELAGDGDRVLKALESRASCEIHMRGNVVTLEGDEAAVRGAEAVVLELADLVGRGHALDPATVGAVAGALAAETAPGKVLEDVVWSRGAVRIAPKTVVQKAYIDAIRRNTVTFGIGPAGTGKTFLAVSMAAAALSRGEVTRIILTRPAVEAGERLGFLPGDLMAKVDPYLRPLFDALHDMLDAEQVQKYLERGSIEVAPLAFMRGRTLNDSFIILDEAQNTTPEQMKMFLTRIGFGSRVVVTGDITQIDLPGGSESGLVTVSDVLEGVEDISFVRFGEADVVRHRLVQRIVSAYREHAHRSAPAIRPAASSGT
jgi:phosphate starvation-inducible PhoH-like protein